MNLVLWLLAGAIVGLVASMVMNPASGDELGGNLLVGMLGAVAGGVAFSPLTNAVSSSQMHFSLLALVLSFLGAIITLVFIYLFRHRR